LINRGITSARKINTFKGACLFLRRFTELLFGDDTVFLHDKRISRFDLAYFTEPDIERGLNSRPFRSNHHNFIIGIIISGPDPSRVTHNKSITVTKNPADGVSAVPTFGRLTQYSGHIHMLSDQPADFNIGVSFLLELVKQLLVFGI